MQPFSLHENKWRVDPEGISRHLLIPSPLEEVWIPGMPARARLFLKRDDLIHPLLSGNKWRKLSGHLRVFRERGYSSLESLGGLHSNHIHALAFVCRMLGIPARAFIRVTDRDSDSPTLAFARDCGIQVEPLLPADYRSMRETEPQDPGTYRIPEGGAGLPGQEGCASIVQEIRQELPSFEMIGIAAGTGTTALGLAHAMRAGETLRVHPVHKDPSVPKLFEIKPFLPVVRISRDPFGGFAAYHPELAAFLRSFYRQTGIELDAVYTGRLLWGLLKDWQTGNLAEDAVIVAIHTGGVQGNAAWCARYGAEIR